LVGLRDRGSLSGAGEGADTAARASSQAVGGVPSIYSVSLVNVELSAG